MKKLVAFIGSPRKKGNTSSIIGEVVRGAAEAGAETKTYNLNDMNIKPCQSCFYCRGAEGCSIKDDMQAVYEDIKDADAVAIGSPIYFGQVTAQTKLLMDRLFPIVDANLQPRYGSKKLALVYSQGQSDADMFKQYLDYNGNLFNYLGTKVIETLLSTDANGLDVAISNKPLMAKAFQTGKALVE